MSLFNLIKIGRSKPTPQQEFLSHDGMARSYEETITSTLKQMTKAFTQSSSNKSLKQPIDSKIETFRKSCEHVLDIMRQVSETESSKELKADKIEKDMKARINLYFEPLQYALLPGVLVAHGHTQQQAVQGIQARVIDCIQKFFSYSYMDNTVEYTGKIPVDITPQQQTNKIYLLDVVVKAVCDSLYNAPLSKKSTAVQLQVVKVLLTGVTSCGMHGKSLRRAITTCLNIYLNSRDSAVQEHAKAGLSQMINSVFHRMVDNSTFNDPTLTSGEEEIEREEEELQVRQETITTDEEDTQFTESEKVVHDFVQDIVNRIVQQNAQQEEHRPSKSKKVLRHKAYQFQNIYEKDAFFIMRQLFQLSLKQKLDPTNPTSANARHISLELVMDILRKYSEPILNSGNGKENFFLKDIKYILCLSLIRNAVEGQIALYELSMRVLEILLRQGFVPYLRGELSSLFLSLLLRSVSSENSSTEQKLIVLTTLQNFVAKDSQFLVNLFVNYDCVIGQENVFEALISSVCGLCRTIKFELGFISQQQEYKIRKAGLQVLTSVFQSMVNFMGNAQVVESESVIEEIRKDKIFYIQAAKLFNEKPAKGIALLVEAGKIPDPETNLDEAAKALAKYLYEHRNTVIDKKVLGEFVGGYKPLDAKVRYEYTALQSFKDMEIVPAFRKYLNTFRLPGEGQIVERVVETFSKHYFKETSGTSYNCFQDEDAAYLVAYSIIMLNTELHNPAFAFRERMPEVMYVASLGNTNGGGDFPSSFLSSIYQDIKSNEIKMEGEALQPQPPAILNSSITLAKRKQVLFDEETKVVYKKEKRNFLRSASQYAGESEPLLIVAHSSSHALSMIQVATPFILELFNVLLKRTDDEQIIDYCLQMYNSLIHLCSRFGLDEQREAFVVSLAKFSKLFERNPTNISDQVNMLNPQYILTQKNMECMKLLLLIAENEGNYLKTSWVHIIQCISELERLRLFATSEPIQEEKKRRSQTLDSPNVYQQLAAIIKKNVKSQQIDALFNGTAQLTEEASIFFIEAVCKVSDRELSEDEPRKFCLVRLVDSVSVNLTSTNDYARIRAIWPRLWNESLFQHYMKFGSSDNIENSMAVIDSLRQLAAKMLECDPILAQQESFQQHYLKPFHEIIQESQSNLIRELIIECVGNLAMKFYAKIDCGWPIILHTLSWSNKIIPNSHQKSQPRKKYTESAHIIQLGFEFTVNIFKEPCFSHVCRNNSFVALVSCLCAFAKQQLLPQIALRSIELLCDSAKTIVTEKVIKLGPIEGEPDHIRFSDKIDVHGQIWQPILLQLSSSSSGSESRIEMRIRSIETLFKLLKDNGKLFSSGFWRMMFTNVLFPIFTEITSPRSLPVPVANTPSASFIEPQDKASISTYADSEWVRTTCHKAMICMVDLFAEYFETIPFMLKDILQLIVACFKRDRPTDILCQIGNGCIHQLVTLIGNKFTSEHWDLICDHIAQATVIMDAASNFFQSSSQSTSSWQDSNFLTCITVQCRAQILLLDTCNDILNAHYDSMQSEHVEKFLNSLLTSYETSRNLNTSQVFSNFLKMQSVSVPLTEFILQETISLTLSFNTLFMMIAETRTEFEVRVKLGHTLLIPLIEQLLKRYLYQVGVFKPAEDQKPDYLGSFINTQETEKLIPIIVRALEGFNAFTQEQFLRYIFRFYPLFCDLITTTADKNNEIRTAVKSIFMRCQAFIPQTSDDQ